MTQLCEMSIYMFTLLKKGGWGVGENGWENSIQMYKKLMLICFTFKMWPIFRNNLWNVVSRGCHALAYVFQFWFASVPSAYLEIPLMTWWAHFTLRTSATETIHETLTNKFSCIKQQICCDINCKLIRVCIHFYQEFIIGLL